MAFLCDLASRGVHPDTAFLIQILENGFRNHTLLKEQQESLSLDDQLAAHAPTRGPAWLDQKGIGFPNTGGRFQNHHF